MIRAALERIASAATWLMAGGLVTGIVFQPVAELFRPYILHSIVIILAIAMIRLDVARLRAYARRPAILGAIVAVNLVATPVFMWLIVSPLGAPAGLEQGLILMAAANGMEALTPPPISRSFTSPATLGTQRMRQRSSLTHGALQFGITA